MLWEKETLAMYSRRYGQLARASTCHRGSVTGLLGQRRRSRGETGRTERKMYNPWMEETHVSGLTALDNCHHGASTVSGCTGDTPSSGSLRLQSDLDHCGTVTTESLPDPAHSVAVHSVPAVLLGPDPFLANTSTTSGSMTLWIYIDI